MSDNFTTESYHITHPRANPVSHPGYNAERIGVAGGSAGGHIVLMLGMTSGVKDLEGVVGGNLDQSSRVQAVVKLCEPTASDAFPKKENITEIVSYR